MHIFNFRGLTLALDPNSGSLFAVDPLAGEILARMGHEARDDIYNDMLQVHDAVSLDEVLAEVESLACQGLVFAPLPAEPPRDDSGPEVKAMCLHVAHDCNLRCLYCFAGTGDFGGGRRLMDIPTGRAAIDFLIRSSGRRRNLELDFFGGEPLLNFPLVRDLVTYGEEQAGRHSKNLRFTLTTNGTLISDEVRQFLNDKKMALVLSIDGRPAVNDRMRPFPGGIGSYAPVADALLGMVESRARRNYYVRGTYTAHNLDFAADVRHLYSLGFREISLEPVVGGQGADYAITQEHLPALLAEYDKLVDFYLECQAQGDPFHFFHFNISTYGGPCLAKRVTGCGAGYDYVAVTPDGDLYPCHQFVGQEEFRLGNVQRGLTRPDVSDKFLRANLYSKPECLDCWARFYCSGGCHASAHFVNGSFFMPDRISCELQKKRIECALGIAAASENH